MARERSLPRWGRWAQVACRAATLLYFVVGGTARLLHAPTAVLAVIGVTAGAMLVGGGATWLVAEFREGWRTAA